jgi:hypothetical protein
MAVKRYNGSSWDTVAGLGAQGQAATSSTIATWVKTASGGETSLSGNDDNSQALSYTVGQELVFINGTLLKRGSDYTATNGTSITGLTALAANDVATVWTVNAFSVTNAISSGLVTTTGDLIYASSANTPARLGIGSTDQVLKVSGGVPAWGAAPVSATSYSLINTGGTALTGAATITISGISGKNRLFCLIFNASSASGNSNFYIRLNSDSGANYGYFNPLIIAPDSVTHDSDDVSDKVYVGAISANAASTLAGFISVDGCNSSGIKTVEHATGSTNTTGGNAQLNVGGGYWSGTGTVSSISITSDTGNFDNGTIWVYGA